MGRSKAGAIQNLPNRVQVKGSGYAVNFQRSDWESLRQFALAAELKSMKAGAQAAGCSLNTLRNKIERLEHQIGRQLFRRSHLGIELTLAGEQLYDLIGDIRAREGAAIRFDDSTFDRVAPNELRLAVTEGLGTFWVVPRLAEFHEAHPNLRLNLECKMAVGDIRDHRSDIAIQLDAPSDLHLVRVRLCTLHVMPFASPQYLKTFGTPSSIDEALSHRFVLQIADQVKTELFDLFAGTNVNPNIVAMQTNTSSAHYWAITNGIGIGMLPTYARAITRNIVPIDMEFRFKRDVWLVYHPDIRRSKEHLAAIQWLRAAFDPKRYPWFSDEFVHPNDFKAEFEGTNVVRLFAGFMDA